MVNQTIIKLVYRLFKTLFNSVCFRTGDIVFVRSNSFTSCVKPVLFAFDADEQTVSVRAKSMGSLRFLGLFSGFLNDFLSNKDDFVLVKYILMSI